MKATGTKAGRQTKPWTTAYRKTRWPCQAAEAAADARHDRSCLGGDDQRGRTSEALPGTAATPNKNVEGPYNAGRWVRHEAPRFSSIFPAVKIPVSLRVCARF